MTVHLAWITTAAARGLDDDEPLALTALRSAGAWVDVVDWHDEEVDWAAYDRAVLRSTWDYMDRIPAFLDWLAAVDGLTDVVNPLPMVRWSLDKHYLAELEAAGLPVPSTTYVEPGERAEIPAAEVIVKPAVGAGSRDVSTYGAEQADLALAHVDRLLGAGRSVLVQPLLPSVAVEGEWPMVFFGGRYSHSASKRVRVPRASTISGLHADETLGLHVGDDSQVKVAQAVVDLVADRFGTPAYARVDLVRGDDGQPCVLEVELVEPSLFLPQGGTAALDALVAAFTGP